MWQPTHVKVAVNQARNLLIKGKNGTNDAFVVIGIGKEKFHTSIKQKSSKTVEWREECELEIPSQGNKASIQLSIYHHNSLGIDEFLGQVAVPLSDFDVYEKPKYRFYRLKGKPEKDKKKGEKERGELEVLVNFLVKSGSFLEANKKEKTKSSTSLRSLGGSLLSFGGGKDKHGIKNFARSVSSKMDKIAKRKKSKSKADKLPNDLVESSQYYGDADPGVISDEEDDFRFDDDVKVFTRSSSPHSTVSRGSSFVHEIGFDDDVASHTSHESSQVLGASLISYDTPNILGETSDKQTPTRSRTPPQIVVSSGIQDWDVSSTDAIGIQNKFDRYGSYENDDVSDVAELSNSFESQSSPSFTHVHQSVQDEHDFSSSSRQFNTIIEEESDKPMAVDTAHEKREPQNQTDYVDLEAAVDEEPVLSKRHFSSIIVESDTVDRSVLASSSEKKKKKLRTKAKNKEQKYQPSKENEYIRTREIDVSSVSKDNKDSPPPQVTVRQDPRNFKVVRDEEPVLSEQHISSITDDSVYEYSYEKDKSARLPPERKEQKHQSSNENKGTELDGSSFSKGYNDSTQPHMTVSQDSREFKAVIDDEPVLSKQHFSSITDDSVYEFSNENKKNTDAENKEQKYHFSKENKDSEIDCSTHSKGSSCSTSHISAQAEVTMLDTTDAVFSSDLSQPNGTEVSRTRSFQEETSAVDEWGEKLFGINSFTGSQDDISFNDSKINISRASSNQDVRVEETRHSKVKALTLNGKITSEDVENLEGRKTKRKGMAAFKNKIFHKSSGKLTEEDSRYVEGGNDKVPAPPTRSSRLPQEIHDKFAGRSREDLLEMIMSLQGVVDKQVRRSSDLEEYIDNLLLRVMESTPQILRTSPKPKGFKSFKLY